MLELEEYQTPFSYCLNEIISGDVNKISPNGFTLLMQAISINNNNLVELLLENNADPDITVKNNYTALSFACKMNGNISIIFTLLRFNANPNICLSNNMSPLILSIVNKNILLTDTLLRYKADPNHKDFNGNTPLIRAVQNKFRESFKSLLNYGALFDEPNYKGITPFFEACLQSDIPTMKLFYGIGANIHIEDTEGGTPLIYAIQNNDKHVIKFLLKSNASIIKENKHGLRALDYAICCSDLETLYYISKKCPKMGQEYIDKVPCIIHLINSTTGKTDIIDFLVRTGAKLDILFQKDNHILTPLTLAILKDDYEMTEKLLRLGANPDLTGTVRPISLANDKAFNGDVKYLDLLRKFGATVI